MRLNELKILLEMSQRDAMDVIHKYAPDVDVSNLNDAEFSKLRRKLAAKYHPDKGEHPDEVLRIINQALDVLKQYSGRGGQAWQDYAGPRSRPQPRQRQQSARSKETDGDYPFSRVRTDYPVWAWAGWSGGIPNMVKIYRNSFEDHDYLKMKAWEISGKKKRPIKADEYRFILYDGRYSRSSITVFANPDTVKTIAGWFLQWADKYFDKQAVIVATRDEIIIIPLDDGKVMNEDYWKIGTIEEFAPDAGNRNPFNDSRFAKVIDDVIANAHSQRD